MVKAVKLAKIAPIFALAVLPTFGFAAEAKVKMVYRSELALFNPKEDTLHNESVVLHAYNFFASSSKQWKPLVSGWEVRLSNEKCPEAKLSIRNRVGNEKVFELKKDREHSWLYRKTLSCAFSSGAPVYKIQIVGDRYFAFDTFEPGWVIFDRKKEEFLPATFRRNVNGDSELNLTRKGQVAALGLGEYKGEEPNSSPNDKDEPTYRSSGRLPEKDIEFLMRPSYPNGVRRILSVNGTQLFSSPPKLEDLKELQERALREH